MHIGNKINHDDKYYIKDQVNKIHEITEVQSEKSLGVYFDPKLTFSKHVNEKIKIANRNLGLIMSSFTYMSKEMFLTLYKSLVRPHLEYASTVWSPRYKKEQKAIENFNVELPEW